MKQRMMKMTKEFEKLWLSQWKMRIEYSGANPVYVGEAKPGIATDEKGWRIKKITYDGDNPTQIDWAEGNRNFDKIWDNRATYSYS